MPHNVIVSLDFDAAESALALVDRLGPAVTHYKVGLQTLVAAGPGLPATLVEQGKSVFLDLKLHEIPNSVAGAIRVAGQLGVEMVTVHASAGSAVLRAAVQAARPFPNLKVVALTVITSLSDAELPEIGLTHSLESQVLRLASLAMSTGCDGVVASVQEAALLRAALPSDALVVCPGIQLADRSKTDQVRVASPAEASRAGATHIVIGRAIASATQPLEVFQRVVAEFENAA
jgi:orotidine-5'-phosphate decarboxylase